MRRAAFIAILAVATVCLVAGASANRKPSGKEKTQIAKVIGLVPKCAIVRVSTVTKKPKWASAEWRDGGRRCSSFASNGVTVEKRRAGRWRFITAGSSFTCGELYARVPKPVAKDLKISCS